VKLAYFDCFAGASGDMLLGALLDAGVDQAALEQELRKLNLPGWTLEAKPALKNGVAATAVTVHVEVDSPARGLADINGLIEASELPGAIKLMSTSVFQRLAEAEAKVHGCLPAEVHFHEVGAVDAIIDIVGVACGLSLLGIDTVHVSPLPLGRGFTRAAHGVLPLPAPAVVELLEGVPVFGTDAPGETVTPTGAAILVTVAVQFGPIPPMRLKQAAYGAGRRDAEYPNVVRLLVGETNAEPSTETLLLLETNIDDMSPQLYEHVFACLFEAGALDVWLSPAQMKKNRPANILAALCRPAHEAVLTGIIFRETTTLGLRRQVVERRSLDRQMREVGTQFGPAQVKVALLDGRVLRLMPEYEDCRRLALACGVPLREVLAEVERAAREDQSDQAAGHEPE
jgi:pyridinium-3,5-bisthiocarboxylic acid mononucleotide nickel chelatase